MVADDNYLISKSYLDSKPLENIKQKYFSSSAWAVLGKPQPEPSLTSVAYTEAGFQGRITKAQIWLRALDVTSEIQKQVRDCRSEPIFYRGLTLNWAGYEITTGGVERSVPSTCGQRAQKQIDVDKEPPQVAHCPGDLWIISRNGSAQVTWDEPEFTDNVGVTRVIERSGHRSGQTLLWGTYDITYIANDAAGNTATCGFKVSVLSEFCPPLADPVGGTQVCKDWGAGGQFKVCEISCNQGLRFSEPVPEFYTCGAEGFWRPTTNPTQTLVYPSCSSKYFIHIEMFEIFSKLFNLMKIFLKIQFVAAKPAQRVVRIKMLFPSDVLCNEAGQVSCKSQFNCLIDEIECLNKFFN